jgi:hypothetical protein
MALGGQTLGLASTGVDKDPVEIRLRFRRKIGKGLEGVKGINLFSRNGTRIPLKSLTSTWIQPNATRPFTTKIYSGSVT